MCMFSLSSCLLVFCYFKAFSLSLSIMVCVPGAVWCGASAGRNARSPESGRGEKYSDQLQVSWWISSCFDLQGLKHIKGFFMSCGRSALARPYQVKPQGHLFPLPAQGRGRPRCAAVVLFGPVVHKLSLLECPLLKAKKPTKLKSSLQPHVKYVLTNN